MSAYNIGKCTKIEKFGKPALTVNVKDNNGAVTENVTIYSVDKDNVPFPGFDSISTGSIVEGNLYQKPGTTFWTLYPAKQKTGGSPMGAGMMKAKTESIAKAQEKKAENIASAQDRNEVMWAKYSAAQLIANHPAYAEITQLNMSFTFQELVKNILNFDPHASKITAVVSDDLQSVKIVARANASVEDDINPEEVPW